MNRSVRLLLTASFLAICALGSSGCSSLRNTHKEYTTVVADPSADEARAIAQNELATKYMREGSFHRAEKALQDALVADVTYGPAHNNLGQLYFTQGKLYLAAWEFEYTLKLMPGRAEPYYNLGMVYEAAEQLDRALEYYSTAHRMDPKNPQYTGNLARAMFKKDDFDPEVKPLLTDLLLYDTRPDWVHWAKQRLILTKFPKPKAASHETETLLPSERNDTQKPLSDGSSHPETPPMSDMKSTPLPPPNNPAEVVLPPPAEAVSSDAPGAPEPELPKNLPTK